MIHLSDINKTYPGAVPLHVLKGINLDIAKGELVSIMGASGSGKSTLLNILGILDSYDTGEYVLDGTLIRNLSENRAAELRNKLIGFVFQSFNLINYKDALGIYWWKGQNMDLKTWLCLCFIRECHAGSVTNSPLNNLTAWGCANGHITCRASCRAVKNNV